MPDKNHGPIVVFALALALSTSSTVVVVPNHAEAQFLKKIKKSVNRDLRKAKRRLGSKKSKRILKTVVGVGIGIAAGKALGGKRGFSPAAAIVVGAIAVGASQSFRKDMNNAYANDYGWAGCISCGKQRIRSSGKITKQRRSAVQKIVKQDAIELQTALKKLGYYQQRIDGDFGKGSRRAVRKFQVANGYPETGRLSAEQRAVLFSQAGEAGYLREGAETAPTVKRVEIPQTPLVLVAVDRTPAVEAIGAPQKTFKSAIRQYRLASSQFTKFSQEAFTGDNSAVVKSELQRDGTINLTIEELGQTQSLKRELNVGIEDFEIGIHPDFGEWVEVRVRDAENEKTVVVNALDQFDSEATAQGWIKKTKRKMTLLAKLTERPVIKQDPELVVASLEEKDGAEISTQIATPAMDQPDPEAPQTETIANNAATTVAEEEKFTTSNLIADISEEKVAILTEPVEPAPANVEKVEPETIEVATAVALNTKASEEEIEILATPVSPSVEVENVSAEPENTIILRDAEAEPGLSQTEASVQLASLSAPEETARPSLCTDTVYLSFAFPEGAESISHYNITPPSDTLMMDNGDSTAYFSGSCIQGRYDYKYVYLEKGQKESDWKHHERKGSFIVAGSVEQCEVNINDPKGSAKVICF